MQVSGNTGNRGQRFPRDRKQKGQHHDHPSLPPVESLQATAQGEKPKQHPAFLLGEETEPGVCKS